MSFRAPSPILVALFAFALACGMDAAIKHIAASYSPLMIMFVRFAIGSAAVGAIYAVARPAPLKAGALKFHALRAVTIVISATTFTYALALLPLAQTITLGFAAPLIVPFLARALLKEKLSPASVWAAFVGFAGVAIAAYEPDMDAMSERRVLGVAMVMISVLAYALQIILLRRRAAEDGAISIGLMGNLMPAVILAAPALALAPLPALQDMGWFVLIGVVGAAFWLALTWAYARAAAQTIAPLEYTALIWATAWGWAVFQEAPKPQTYLGAAFIIGACALAAWDERRRGAPTAHIIDAEGPLP